MQPRRAESDANLLKIAAFVVGGLGLTIVAFAIGIGSGGGNPTKDAKDQQRVDLADAKAQGIVDKLSIQIDSCAALNKNLKAVQDLQATLVTLPDDLAKAKKPDGTPKLSEIDLNNVRKLSADANNKLQVLITLAKNCSGVTADKSVASQWEALQTALAELTTGNLLELPLSSYLIQAVDEDQLVDQDGTSAIGNNNVPLISQYDYPNVPYKPNVANAGCGIVATAMVLKFYNQNLPPEKQIPAIKVEDLAAYSMSNGFRNPGAGTADGFWRSLAKTKGLQVDDSFARAKPLSTKDWDKILSYLKAGKPVIVSGAGGTGTYIRKNGKTGCKGSPFSCGGHFVVLTGINADGSINVNDSALNQYKTPSYSLEILKKFTHSARVIWADL